MARIRELLSSPFLSMFLLILCLFALIQYNNVSKDLKREQGSRVENGLLGYYMLTYHVESKVEELGADAINNDILQYANHIILINTSRITRLEILLDDYQMLLHRISNERDEKKKKLLINAVRALHKDLSDIFYFAKTEFIDSDSRAYAKLLDPNTKVSKKFNLLIQKKIDDNKERLASIHD